MRWRWWRRTRPGNGAAAAAKKAAESKMREARRDWPEVIRAGDELTAMIERALRGQT